MALVSWMTMMVLVLHITNGIVILVAVMEFVRSIQCLNGEWDCLEWSPRLHRGYSEGFDALILHHFTS